MKRRALQCQALPLLLLALTAGSCTFTKFDDFESKAPAAKIEQEGGRSSASFGAHLTSVRRRQAGKPLDGAALLAAGNSPVALNTITFSSNGEFSNAAADDDDFRKDLGEPDLIAALAAAPQEVEGGPFIYVGLSRKKVGAVRIVDINTYGGPEGSPAELSAPDEDIENFGIGLASGNLGGGTTADDLVIGADGNVVLWRSSGWPNFSRASDALVVNEQNGGPRWPAGGKFTVLAAGELADSADRDEVVVASPEKNYVAVLHHIADDPTSSVPFSLLEIPLPDDAKLFGSSLLIANVDKDDHNELIIGAQSSGSGDQGAVYVYKLRDEHFSDAADPPDPIVIAAPDGAKSFGAALAQGKFDTTDSLLAVGAPGSSVEGTATAGKIFLFDVTLGDPVSTIALVRPVEKGQLGSSLTNMQFKGIDKVHDVLVSGGETAVYVFFANVTANHKDIRR